MALKYEGFVIVQAAPGGAPHRYKQVPLLEPSKRDRWVTA